MRYRPPVVSLFLLFRGMASNAGEMPLFKPRNLTLPSKGTRQDKTRINSRQDTTRINSYGKRQPPKALALHSVGQIQQRRLGCFSFVSWKVFALQKLLQRLRFFLVKNDTRSPRVLPRITPLTSHPLHVPPQHDTISHI